MDNLTLQLNTSGLEPCSVCEDIPRVTKTVGLVYLGILMVIGTPGNGLLFVTLVKKVDRATTDYYVIHLAIVEFFCSSCLTIMNGIRQESGVWIHVASGGFCKLYWFISYMNGLACNVLLTAIAIDRYIKTCRPLNQFYTNSKAKHASVIIGILSCICSIYVLPTVTVTENLSCDPYPEYFDLVLLFTMIFGVVSMMDIFTMAVSYTCVSLALFKRHRNKIRIMATTSDTSKVSRNTNTGQKVQDKDKDKSEDPGSHLKPDTACGSQHSGASQDVNVTHTSSQITNVDDSSKGVGNASTDNDNGATAIGQLGSASHHVDAPRSLNRPTAVGVKRVDTRQAAAAAVNRTTRMMFVITVVHVSSFLFSWFITFTGIRGLGELGIFMSFKINMMNCITDPVLFFAMSSRLRNDVKQLFHRR